MESFMVLICFNKILGKVKNMNKKSILKRGKKIKY